MNSSVIRRPAGRRVVIHRAVRRRPFVPTWLRRMRMANELQAFDLRLIGAHAGVDPAAALALTSANVERAAELISRMRGAVHLG